MPAEPTLSDTSKAPSGASRAKARVSFGGLDTLRGLAAMLVVVHHIELYNHRDGAFSLYSSAVGSSLRTLGGHSVEVFFVLSGFLITYLLKREREVSGRIQLGAFWMRRTLRIWPLYFLIVAVGFVLVPWIVTDAALQTSHYGRLISEQAETRGTILWYFVFFVPNLALAHGHAVPGAAQAWSIGVEEQFYLLWPLLMWVTRRHFWVLCVLIAAKPLAMHIAGVYFTLFPIEFMGWGALGALALYHQEKRVKLLLGNTWVRSVILLAFVSCWISPVAAGHDYKALALRGAVFSAGLLAVVSAFERRKEPRAARWLGKHSYGIYMLHPLAMFVFLTLVPLPRSGEPRLAYWLRDYALVVGATLFAAYVSYRFLERPFLTLKKRFQVVRSGS